MRANPEGLWEDDCTVCLIGIVGEGAHPESPRCPSCRDAQDHGESPTHLQSARALLAEIEANPESSIDYGKALREMRDRVSQLEGYERSRTRA